MQHLHFRSIWISKTHLGGRNLKNNQFHKFLKTTESENLYLVADIFELWKLRNSWQWPEIKNKIYTPKHRDNWPLLCPVGRELKARGITPCSTGDTSADMEYELQIAVEGKTAEADLPPSAIENQW